MVRHQLLQLGEHGVGVEARALDQFRGVEAVLLVRVADRPHLLQLELWPEAFVLRVGAADLEELPLLPLVLAGGEERTVRPDHRRGDALGVAEAAGVERLALAGRAVLLLDELHEAVGILVGGQFVQRGKSRFDTGHERALLGKAGVWTPKTALDSCNSKRKGSRVQSLIGPASSLDFFLSPAIVAV